MPYSRHPQNNTVRRQRLRHARERDIGGHWAPATAGRPRGEMLRMPPTQQHAGGTKRPPVDQTESAHHVDSTGFGGDPTTWTNLVP